MSTLLLDLIDYAITDCGEVIFKHDAIVTLLREHKSCNDILAFECDDIKLSNKRHPEHLIKIKSINNIPENLSAECYKFNLPKKYREIALNEYVEKKLIEQFPDLPDQYLDRVHLELDMMRERKMEDLVRILIYMIDVFEENGVVYGVGRGSACASLVLFLLKVHMVDPILYEIDITEFLR
jgi:DNA polymerase III alpha subunit